jgi:hypothetical protein
MSGADATSGSSALQSRAVAIRRSPAARACWAIAIPNPDDVPVISQTLGWDTCIFWSIMTFLVVLVADDAHTTRVGADLPILLGMQSRHDEIVITFSNPVLLTAPQPVRM